MNIDNTSWHSYPSIFALGHKAIGNLLTVDVICESKADGSQLSFGIFDGEIRLKSKSVQMNIEAPEPMFQLAAETVKEIAPLLHNNWTYRGEFLSKNKHNSLAYNRTPNKYIII